MIFLGVDGRMDLKQLSEGVNYASEGRIRGLAERGWRKEVTEIESRLKNKRRSAN
jgi:hypothetical protein